MYVLNLGSPEFCKAKKVNKVNNQLNPVSLSYLLDINITTCQITVSTRHFILTIMMTCLPMDALSFLAPYIFMLLHFIYLSKKRK